MSFPIHVVTRLYTPDDELYGGTFDALAKAADAADAAERAAAVKAKIVAAGSAATKAVQDRLAVVVREGGDPAKDPELVKLRKTESQAVSAAVEIRGSSVVLDLERHANELRAAAREAPDGYDAAAAMRRHLAEAQDAERKLQEAHQAFVDAHAEFQDRLQLLTSAMQEHPDETTRDTLASALNNRRAARGTLDVLLASRGHFQWPEWLDDIDRDGVYRRPSPTVQQPQFTPMTALVGGGFDDDYDEAF